MSESHHGTRPRRAVDKGKWIGACVAIFTGIGIAIGAIFDLDRMFFWGLLGVGSGVIAGVLISTILTLGRPGPKSDADAGGEVDKPGAR